MKTTFDDLKKRTQNVLCNTYGRYPLAVARAEGSRMWDLEDREYIDLLAGIAVTNLGHCHPELADVAAEHARKMVHVSNLFYQQEQVELAEALLSTSHAQKVFFCNSGAEANEAAIKLVRRYMKTIRQSDAFEIITLEQSFHGRTLATLTATGQDKVKDGFAPLPEGFRTAPWDDIAALEQAVGDKTAAIMIEVVQGEGGVRPMSAEYAQGISTLCRKHGLLLIVDEIQSGMCRTGHFWAFQHYGLEPDVFTSSKALANGLPMGAMFATDEAAQGFTPGAHATTFGGGGLLSAVALKTVQIMLRDNLAQRAANLGAQALELFEGLRSKYPQAIADIRGRGLMLGIELTFAGDDIWKGLMDRGIVCNLAQGNVLRLLPALTVEFEDLEHFAATVDELLETATADTAEEKE